MGEGIIQVFMEYWPIFLRGAAGTLEYAFIAVFFGSILGFRVALMRISRVGWLSKAAAVYANVLRGTPLLVQLYMAYYCLPRAIPALNVMSRSSCVLLSQSLNSSAYVSELIRT
ncbi:ABC transporter permease subunit, partial [Galactobacillus timonensis]|uniref:ABC transporter permease subunit n=1 Tax=Galactobacillus timonensis TaxID=2041840 RepID=UPI0023F0C76A